MVDKLINFGEVFSKFDPMDETLRPNPTYTFQHPARVVLCGPSGSGKTNTLMNVLMGKKEYKMNYDYVCVCAKDLTEKMYVGYRRWLTAKQAEVRKSLKDPSYVLFDFVDSIDKIPKLESIDKEKMNIIVIDDMMNEKNQDVVKELMMRGRKNNCSTIYLSQYYHKTPQLVRNQCNYVCAWEQNEKGAVSMLMREFADGVPNEIFKKMYYNAIDPTDDMPRPFLMIDRKTPKLHYRKGFKIIYTPEKDSEGNITKVSFVKK